MKFTSNKLQTAAYYPKCQSHPFSSSLASITERNYSEKNMNENENEKEKEEMYFNICKKHSYVHKLY